MHTEKACNGWVAPARRPAGWSAPGTPPAAPTQRRELWPAAGEALVYLSGDWRILQRRDGHRWSLDDLLTAWCAAELTPPVPPARIADLGCGIGAVLLLLAWRFPTAACVGVEAQPESVALARRSVAWNGVEGRVEVCHGDLRQADLPAAVFDLVTATPPYLPLGSGCVPLRRQQSGCHFEERGGIEDYCVSAERLLAPGGRFVVCHAAAQQARAERAAAEAGLRIERRLAVVPRAGKAPLFTVYVMRRSAEAATTTALSSLIVRGEDGQWTPAFRAVRRAMGMPV